MNPNPVILGVFCEFKAQRKDLDGALTDSAEKLSDDAWKSGRSSLSDLQI